METGIALTRTFQIGDLFGILRSMRVFIDGVETKKLPPFARRKLYSLPPGKYDIYIKMDWCRSPVTTVEVQLGQVVHFKCLNRFWGFSIIAAFVCPGKAFWLRKAS